MARQCKCDVLEKIINGDMKNSILPAHSCKQTRNTTPLIEEYRWSLCRQTTNDFSIIPTFHNEYGWRQINKLAKGCQNLALLCSPPFDKVVQDQGPSKFRIVITKVRETYLWKKINKLKIQICTKIQFFFYYPVVCFPYIECFSLQLCHFILGQILNLAPKVWPQVQFNSWTLISDSLVSKLLNFGSIVSPAPRMTDHGTPC